MDKKHPDSKPLAAPEEALGFYLDSLLMDVPLETPEDAVAPVATAPEAAVDADADERANAVKKTVVEKAAGNTAKKTAEKTPEEKASAAEPPPGKPTEQSPPDKIPTPQPTAPRVSALNVTPAAAVVPLKVERRELDSRPFAEPPRPQSLLSGPPVVPLLIREESAPVVSRPEVLPTPVEPASPRPVSPKPEITKPASPKDAPSVEKPTLVEVSPAEPVSVETPVVEAEEETSPVATGVVQQQQAGSRDAPADASHAAPQRAGVPEWAEHRFQCLTFMVAGLTLAAPLEKLHGIIEWHGEMTVLPGYAAWFMGLQPNRGQNVRVIDTAQIIMPEGRRPDARPALERVKYVVLMDDGRWGLAVDAIAQILTLEPDGVRWRGERSKRPWLAGTAVEQMCAVLDIDSLSEQLKSGLKIEDD